ncbi:MAG: Crp/Fnr family transcriptional regulator [Saprospiraceae bacterium]|jgi:CRP-like cAMP-binding protein|nr:Crp/Fnr family transcriptional regulator [Saprospiraceae bacterium]
MFEKVKEAFSHFVFITPKNLVQLASIAKLGSVKKKEHLIKVGDLNYNVVVVLKGLLRHYVVSENGEEKTLRFAPEKKIAAMLDTIFHNKPCTENIMALEDTVYLKFDFREIDRLVSDNLQLLKVQNQVFKEIISENVEQIKFLTVLTPEARYLYFCQSYPNLEQRIKQKYLASYLGITVTSLSRIRARISKF